MSKLNTLLVALISSLLFFYSNSYGVMNDRVVAYAPTVIELTGRVVSAKKYGVPNFGENPKTDAVLEIPILQLDSPIAVRGDPQSEINADSFRGIRSIQLVFHPWDTPYRSFVNKKVTVSGSLSQGTLAGHFTKIIMDVKTIRLQDESK